MIVKSKNSQEWRVFDPEEEVGVYNIKTIEKVADTQGATEYRVRARCCGAERLITHTLLLEHIRRKARCCSACAVTKRWRDTPRMPSYGNRFETASWPAPPEFIGVRWTGRE